MKTSHEEDIEGAENDLAKLREDLIRLEMERRYPPTVCDRVAWQVCKEEQIAKVQKSIALRRAALVEWSQQLNLSWA